ncbi:MAG: DUF2490 domain-containing protein [Bacteroidia bacterium]
MMREIIKSMSIALVVLLLSVGHSFSQDTTVHVVRDLESWTSARLNYKINKKFGIRFSQNLRLQQNSMQFNNYFSELAFKYEPFKNLTLELETRYGVNAKNSGNVNYLRLFYAAKYEYSLDRLDFSARAAYQNVNTMSVSAFDFAEARYNWRYQLKSSYNIKNWKLDPELSFEGFRKNTTASNPGFDKYRIRLTTDYNFNDLKISPFYAFERELNEEYPLNASIIGLNLTYNLKRKKNEKD